MATKVSMRALHKIGGILIALVLLPVLVYVANEISSLNEQEQMIEEIYEQQLETILYSVNQRAWDVANSWASNLTKVLEQQTVTSQAHFKEEARQFLALNPTLRAVFWSDSLVTSVDLVAADTLAPEPLRAAVASALRAAAPQVTRLLRQKRAGYRKLESTTLVLTGGQTAVVLVFVPDAALDGVHLVGMIVSTTDFIQKVLAPKLQEVSREQFLVGLFRKDASEPVYATGPLQLEEARQTRSVWLFPDYVLGIRLGGTSIEDVMRERLLHNLLLVCLLGLVLVSGAVVVYRSIRREIELARMKADFVSNVSHELRTPLALIRMFVETLEMGRIRTEAQRQEYYRILSHEAERLTRLVNNILNFSKMEAGQKHYRRDPVALNQVVEEVMQLYAFNLQSKAFETDVQLADALPYVSGDAEAIGEALINLIENAVKYSPEEKHLKIKTGVDASYVYVEVADRGIGMALDEQQRVFDKFYRVSKGLVHDVQGTGLGLTLVKHIMDAHGGRVVVVSVPKEGSRFRLLFKPMHVALPSTASAPAVVAESERADS